jgi:hypothetical protein
LREALEQDLGVVAAHEIPCFGTRLNLRLAMLQFPLRVGPSEELVWYVAEANALRRVRREISAADRARLIAETRRWVIRDLRAFVEPGRNGATGLGAPPRVPESLGELLDRFGDEKMERWSDQDWEGFTLQALWRICCDGVRDLPQYTSPPAEPVRHRNLLFEATGADSDLPVNELLSRFCAGFLDQGLAHWPMPGREGGFYRTFRRLYRQPYGPPDRWMRGLERELSRLYERDIGPLQSIEESLSILGVAEEDREGFISATLLALRGWAGMIRQIEERGDRVVQPVPPGSLIEFLAIRLILDRFSLSYTARESLGFTGPLSELRAACRRRIERPWPPTVEQRAFLVFELSQIMGLSPDVLYHLDKPAWRAMLEEIESFTGFERRRVFHLAYERRFYTQTADAVALHVKVRHPPRQPPGSRRSSASTSAKNRSAATWRSSSPTSRPTGRPASSRWRSIIEGWPTPTSFPSVPR